MASKCLRLNARLLIPQPQLARAYIPTTSNASRSASLSSSRHAAPALSVAPIRYQQSVRWHSTPASKSKIYDFEAMKTFTTDPSPGRIIVDVREPHEYAEGYIPGAINMPIKSAPEAILMPAEEFEDRFGYPKPAADQEVVFYCKSGVRSNAAAQLAEQAGYQNIGEYRGSWLDWSKNGGEVKR